MKQFFLKLALLMGVGCVPMYGDGYCQDYYCPSSIFSKEGFSTGVYGTFQTVFFNVRNRITDDNDGDVWLWRYDSIQKAPGVGSFISYDFGGCGCFVSSIRLDGTTLSETSEHHFKDGDFSDNIEHQAGLRWAVDLSYIPAILINDFILGYCKAGFTVAGIKEKALIRNEDAPWEVEDSLTVMHHPGGYVLGAGVRVAISDGLSFFTEYNWRDYVSPFSSLKTIALECGQNDTVDTKITSAHSIGLTFGISAKF